MQDAPSDTFELPAHLPQVTWMRDGLHIPRPIPRLVAEVMDRWMGPGTGSRMAVVNGYLYIGFGAGAHTPNLETAPQADPGEAWREFYLPRVRAIVNRLLDADYSGLSPVELLNAFDETIRDSAVAFAYTMSPVGPLSTPAQHLMSFCRKRFGEDGDLRALTLLQGFENETAATGSRLVELSTLAASLPEVGAALREGRFDAVAMLEGGAQFERRFREYLHEYGRGNQTWFEFHRPSWEEDRSVPLGMIAAILGQDRGRSAGAQARASAEREELLGTSLRDLTSEEDREKLGMLLVAARDYVAVIEERALWQLGANHALRFPALTLGQRFAADGTLASAEDVFHLRFRELETLAGGAVIDDLAQTVEARRAAVARWAKLTPPRFLGAPPPPGLDRIPMLSQEFGLGIEASEEAGIVRGVGASRGIARGVARVILDLDDAMRFAEGEVLVCPFTAPPWTPLFGLAAAVVTDAGGVLSHAAIAAREYAIPAVTGAQNATVRIPDGALVEVDGAAGTVRLI